MCEIISFPRKSCEISVFVNVNYLKKKIKKILLFSCFLTFLRLNYKL